MFADAERNLRSVYAEALGRCGVLPDAMKRSRLTDSGKHAALGDMLNVVHHGGDILGDDRLKWRGAEKFVGFRNKLMHGALDSVTLHDLRELLLLLPGLRELMSALTEKLPRELS